MTQTLEWRAGSVFKVMGLALVWIVANKAGGKLSEVWGRKCSKRERLTV